MSGTFSVKNFAKFQHYKDRSPPWIKLYNDLLDDYDFGHLPDASKMHLIAIWLLASRYDNKIPADPEWVARRINATAKVDLAILFKAGFLEPDQECSETLAESKQAASKPLDQSRGEKRESREDKYDQNFERVWEIYPRKVSKGDAVKPLSRALEKTTIDVIEARLKLFASQCAGKDPQYIPHFSKWLNAEKWLDEAPPVTLQPNGSFVAPSRHSPQPGETREDYIRRCIVMNRA